jgi:hypothetical protein
MCLCFGVLLDGPPKILKSPKYQPSWLYRPHEGLCRIGILYGNGFISSIIMYADDVPKLNR